MISTGFLGMCPWIAQQQWMTLCWVGGMLGHHSELFPAFGGPASTSRRPDRTRSARPAAPRWAAISAASSAASGRTSAATAAPSSSCWSTV